MEQQETQTPVNSRAGRARMVCEKCGRGCRPPNGAPPRCYHCGPKGRAKMREASLRYAKTEKGKAAAAASRERCKARKTDAATPSAALVAEAALETMTEVSRPGPRPR